MTILKKQLGFAPLIAIVIVVVLIMAGGAGYYFYKSPKGPTKEAKKIEQQLDECFTEMRTKPTQETQEKCRSAQVKFKDFIKDLKDPLICEQFELEQFGMRNSCLSSVAKNLEDPSICEKISPKGPQFPKPQSDCYTGVAVALKNYSICGKIIGPASPKLTSSCYTEVAVTLNDPLGCEKIAQAMSGYEISFEERIVWAENFCYKKIAEILGDASMCKKIQNLDSRGRCWLAVSEVVPIEDPNICEEIEKEADWLQKKLCYENTFSKAKNIDFCEKVRDQRQKDRCYVELEHYMNDLSDCKKIQHQKFKDHCYLHFILKQYPRDIKESEAITRLKAFCGEMFPDSHSQSQHGRDICYFNIVNYSMDPGYKYRGWEYCKLIQAQDLREKCEEIISR